MPRIDLNGISLHYELSGKPAAPVLVLSGSLGTTLEMWEPQMEELERHFQVLRYDMRGHGRSDVPRGPYSIDLLGGDVLSLIDALDFEKINFCGLSVGGVIGQWLGIHAPSRLSKLALCNTAAKIGNSVTWGSRIAQVDSDGMTSIVDGVLERWFTASFIAKREQIVERMQAMLAANDPAGYVATCCALRDMDLREEVSSIACPTLIVAGEYDMVTTVADARFLKSQVAGAMLSILPAAHISSAEVPEQFNAALLRFLNQDGAE